MNIEDIVRGYTNEQYAYALYETLVNYLSYKKIIDMKDLRIFEEEHYHEILGKIVERDREKSKKAYEEYLKRKGENNGTN